MEQHGNYPEKNVIAVIPARYASTRLPGKLLLDVGGLPLIIRTLEQVRKCSLIGRVIVAADDDRIARTVREHGAECRMTSPAHESGSDRIAEVATSLPEDSIIVNIQGDEPMISPRTIDSAVRAMIGDESADIVTTCETIDDIADVLSPNVVKVVCGREGNALYFSRSPIPYLRNEASRAGTLQEALEARPENIGNFRKHTGLYVYRRASLLKFAGLGPASLERIEMLEQLRALEHGMRIKVVEVSESSIGVDTFEDLERVRRLVSTQ